jgi:7,8-dihydropterin-6-yl-methyl-4-(beta-D-ribofuranosyl)aminobenzene 5'-phosphate synthase
MKKITCLIDNSVKQSSPFWGEHGLSFCLEVDQKSVLFDTGCSEVVLLHNLEQLSNCLPDATAVILSHAHLDHTGGLMGILSKKPGLPLYASPDLFRPRFTLREDTYESIGLPLTQKELTQFADLHLSADPVEVLPGLWTTGEIVERPEPEGSSPHLFVPKGDGWQPDPYRDDMSLVMETQKGLVVICGCCHAGLLNTLAHVQRTFQQPIHTVMGGTHLISADEADLQHVVEVLRDTYGALRFYLNHCTGAQAYLALANAFGDRVNLCPAGTILIFE